jgi:hypothetical protein
MKIWLSVPPDGSRLESQLRGGKYDSYAAPRNQYLRRLAGAKLSRVLGQALIPDWLGALIFERFFLKQAPKPPLDLRTRRLLCSLYGPELDRFETVLAGPLPKLRNSWKA